MRQRRCLGQFALGPEDIGQSVQQLPGQERIIFSPDLLRPRQGLSISNFRFNQFSSVKKDLGQIVEGPAYFRMAVA